MINSLVFRSIQSRDVNKVLEIYNFHILNGLSNFEEAPITFENFSIICNNILKCNLPFIVCEKDKTIIGFAYLNTFRSKSGYRFSYENSIYIANDFTGLGIGNKLLKKLIIEASKHDHISNIVAVIGGNESIASIKIHKKNGFKMVGTLKKIGYKKDKWLDVIYMQKILDEKN